MANKILTQERLKELFHYDSDTGIFKRYKKLGPQKESAGHVVTSGHRQIMVDKKLYMAHNLAWLYVHGNYPTCILDHINRNPDDNKISNLRLANFSENQQNTKVRTDNLCGHKGLSFDSKYNVYKVRISKNGKTYNLGRFKNIQDAIKIRKNAENDLFTHHVGA